MIAPHRPGFDIDEAFPLGDGTADTTVTVECPYCGETSNILVDPGSGSAQEYIEDCPVCCRPWRVRVRYDEAGKANVDLGAEDGE
ncbi:MAG: CPXCG motif-containing cysteine-rich protein [Longimicrobiales bacterium]